MRDSQLRFDPPIIAPRSPAEGQAYRQLYRLSTPATFVADDVLQVAEKHSAIADRLLRVANSMRRGTPRQISSVRHAIVILGARGLREFSEPVVDSMEARLVRRDARSA